MTDTTLPRILTIMGSGETAPTMVKVHRTVLDRLGAPPVPAVVLDTPFGFQENADELVARIVNYFAESLRAPIDVASTRADDVDPFAAERLVGQVRDASYIFAGPGSPTYALRKWSGTIIPSLLREHLEHGGAVTFASAAALTLGVSTIPVYEIYKVGEDPRWETGLDLTSVAGLSVAVIPHYNNAEGGTHDTRFCYLGERRLAYLENELPDGAFVLGVDEHTAIILDLDARTATIAGNGVVTVRAAGRPRTWSAGESVPIDDFANAAADLASGGPGTSASRTVPSADSSAVDEAPSAAASNGASPLLKVVREKEDDFSQALASRDMSSAVQAILELEADLTAWAHEIPAGDELDRGHASLRSLIVELGRSGEAGVRDPREVLGPFVEAMLELRQRARADRRFEDADEIRVRLGELGIEVRDSTEGSDWLLVG